MTVTSTAMPTLDPADVYPIVGELTAHDAWSRDRLLEQQRRRIGATIRHAVEASAYYRDVLGRSVDPGASLQELPILTKSTLMGQWDRIVTDPRLRLQDVEAHLAGERPGTLLLGEYRVCATSGTTGERAVIVYDRAGWHQVVANILRFVAMAGVLPDSRLVGVGAPTPLHLTNRAAAELRAGRSDAPRLSVLTPLPEVVAALNAYQPELVMTYPSFIRRLVEEQEAGSLRIHPQKLYPTAEVLTPEVRAMARRAWGADILDSYGCTEGGLLGTECPEIAGIHVAEDLLVFEAGRRTRKNGTARHTERAGAADNPLQPRDAADPLRGLRRGDDGRRAVPLQPAVRPCRVHRRPTRGIPVAPGQRGRRPTDPRWSAAGAARRGLRPAPVSDRPGLRQTPARGLRSRRFTAGGRGRGGYRPCAQGSSGCGRGRLRDDRGSGRDRPGRHRSKRAARGRSPFRRAARARAEGRIGMDPAPAVDTDATAALAANACLSRTTVSRILSAGQDGSAIPPVPLSAPRPFLSRLAFEGLGRSAVCGVSWTNDVVQTRLASRIGPVRTCGSEHGTRGEIGAGRSRAPEGVRKSQVRAYEGSLTRWGACPLSQSEARTHISLNGVVICHVVSTSGGNENRSPTLDPACRRPRSRYAQTPPRSPQPLGGRAPMEPGHSPPCSPCSA